MPRASFDDLVYWRDRCRDLERAFAEPVPAVEAARWPTAVREFLASLAARGVVVAERFAAERQCEASAVRQIVLRARRLLAGHGVVIGNNGDGRYSVDGESRRRLRALLGL